MIEHSTHLIVLTKVNMLDELGLRMIEIQWDEFGHLIQLVERKTFEEIVVIAMGTLWNVFHLFV